MRVNIRRSVLGALIVVPLVLAQGTQSNAATVQFEGAGVAKGISGLIVGTETFNISFIHQLYAVAFPLGELFGVDLAQSIATTLNGEKVTSVEYSNSDVRITTFYIPVGIDEKSIFAAKVMRCGGSTYQSSCPWTYSGTGIYGIAVPRPWAVPVLVTTPLPSALPLFGTALGLLGFMGWRRRRKSRA